MTTSPATPPPLVHRLRVRYVECDMQGVVFNSHYYTWMDLAHTELVRDALGTFERLFDLGVDVMVAESSARFHAPARFDQEIDVEVVVEDLTTTSMTTGYTFRHGDDVLVVGRVRHVCVQGPPYAKTPWPEALRVPLAARLGTPAE